MNFKKLHGIVPPVITPLNSDGSIDVNGLEKLINHLINGGVHGLFILGTTGEGPALGIRRQKDMIRETVRINAGRLPILVGISNAALEDTLDAARERGKRSFWSVARHGNHLVWMRRVYGYYFFRNNW